MTDADTLARTIWGEARGEGLTGMQAVVAVILNRCAAAQAYVSKHGHPHPLYGDGSPKSACLKPYQFSCWLPSDPNLAKLRAVDISDPQFAQAREIAEQAIAGRLTDPTGGATSYYAAAIDKPRWAVGREPSARIGGHLFFCC